MTDKEKDSILPEASPAEEVISFSLDALKKVGAVPGSQPPVKQQLTWKNDEGKSFKLDTYVRRQSYKDIADMLDGKKEYSPSAIISRLICDANGKSVLTQDDVDNLHQGLIAELMKAISKVNGFAKKKQAKGKS